VTIILFTGRLVDVFQVPTSLDEVCAQAADSLDAALSEGPSRLRVSP